MSGPGASALTVARSAAAGTPEFRIFTVTAGAEVTIAGLTITGGRAAIDDGGGIFNVGTLTVTGSTLSGNSAELSRRRRRRHLQRGHADGHRLHPQRQRGRLRRRRHLQRRAR